MSESTSSAAFETAVPGFDQAARSTVPVIVTESVSARWRSLLRDTYAADAGPDGGDPDADSAGAGVLVSEAGPGSAVQVGAWLRSSPANGAVLLSTSGVVPHLAERSPRELEVTGPAPTPEELVVRISMVQSRVARARRRLELPDGWIDLAAGVLCRGTERISLTAIEAAIVLYLSERAGQIVSPDELLERVLGYRPGVRTRALHYAILRLRRKIEADPGLPSLVQTIRGRGYRWGLGPPRDRPPPPTVLGLPLLGVLGAGQAFVGREAQASELRERLQRDRLVVLTGPAGVGKTRLAVEVARRFARREPGARVFFVRCEPDGEREAAAAALLRLLGGRLLEREPPEVTAQAILSRHAAPVCVVLDDIAVADDAVAEFVLTVARASPSVVVIATSHLGLAATLDPYRYRLGPLEPAAAQQMFWHCIRRVRASAEREPGVQAAVARIVELSDGLPLCIELAAARGRLMPLRGLVERLTADPGAFESTDVRIPGHHRSLTSSLTLAVGALSIPAQVMLRQLAVFRGGFDARAATSVCRPPSGSVTDALDELVAANLVALDGASAAQQRYGLLGVVRRFVKHDLGPGTNVACSARHARYYARVGRELGTQVMRVGDGPAVHALAAETDNLVAAMRHALADAPHVAAALPFTVRLAYACRRQSPLWRALLLELQPGWQRLPVTCRLPFEYQRAALAAVYSQPDALARLLACAEAARAVGHQDYALRATLYAHVAGARLDAESLRSLADEARSVARPGEEADAYQGLALLAAAEGDVARAREALWRARNLCDMDTDVTRRAMGRVIWANQLIADLRLDEARAELETCLMFAPAWTPTLGSAYALLVAIDIERGHLDDARQRLDDYLGNIAPDYPNGQAEAWASFFGLVLRHLHGEGGDIIDAYRRLRDTHAPHGERLWVPSIEMLIAVAHVEWGTAAEGHRALERARAALHERDRVAAAMADLCQRFLSTMAPSEGDTGPRELAEACARAVGRLPGVGEVVPSAFLRMVPRVIDRRRSAARGDMPS